MNPIFCAIPSFKVCKCSQYLMFNLGCVNLDVYGNNCDIPCLHSCPENRCHIANGACFRCAPGWIGSFCNTGQQTISGCIVYKCRCKLTWTYIS